MDYDWLMTVGDWIITGGRYPCPNPWNLLLAILGGERNFTGMIRLNILKWGDYLGFSRWVQVIKLVRRQKRSRKVEVEGEIREVWSLRRAWSAIVGFEDIGDHEAWNVISPWKTGTNPGPSYSSGTKCSTNLARTRFSPELPTKCQAADTSILVWHTSEHRASPAVFLTSR